MPHRYPLFPTPTTNNNRALDRPTDRNRVREKEQRKSVTSKIYTTFYILNVNTFEMDHFVRHAPIPINRATKLLWWLFSRLLTDFYIKKNVLLVLLLLLLAQRSVSFRRTSIRKTRCSNVKVANRIFRT